VTRTPSGAISRELSGIVISAGLASNTVKVQVAKEEWNKKVKKVSSCSALPTPAQQVGTVTNHLFLSHGRTSNTSSGTWYTTRTTPCGRGTS
jgi:hypothetical protein